MQTSIKVKVEANIMFQIKCLGNIFMEDSKFKYNYEENATNQKKFVLKATV